MPQQTKIFRVFVSSTFTDMKEERRILQKEVFPRLEKFCESNNAKFQAVDLRWGVIDDAVFNHQTVELCLNEIERCQRISPKPNFIILLGDRYGWQPIPSKIPENEMVQILEMLADDEKEIIAKWYWLDTNSLLPNEKNKAFHEFVLQPRKGELEIFDNWQLVESTIREILRKAVSSIDLTLSQRVKYFASATHQEILSGALNSFDNVTNPGEHVFAFVRNIEGLPKDKKAEGFIDLEGDDGDRLYSAKQLNDLKADLKQKLEHYSYYSSTWINGKSNIVDPKEFEDKVYAHLEKVIKEQLNDLASPDEIEHEVKLHREFKDRLNEHFQGRVDVLDKIGQYISSKDDKKVLSLFGDSGSGKSSVMAQAIKQNEKNNVVTVYRFIGTTSKTTNIESLLNSVCTQISAGYGIKLESLIGEGREKSLYEMQGLTEAFKKCLALATTEKPLVIYLDALDQLSESGNTRSLYWIPRELPDHAKVIVSCLPEFEKYLSATHLENIPPLPEPDAWKILTKWFESIKRTLTDHQFILVIAKFNKTGLPIYLKLAFERAKHWHSYDKNIALGDDISGIINDFFEWLEVKHTKELVTNVICYMLCGRYQGLAENEILEILVFDKDYWEKIFLPNSHKEHRIELEGVTKIPIIVWSRLFLDLEPYLTEKDADGLPIITFFHRRFIEVLKERYHLVEESSNS